MSIYDSIYNLFNTYVYGGNIVVGSHQDLVATLMSTIAVVFMVSLPFLVVWKVIKLIMGG